MAPNFFAQNRHARITLGRPPRWVRRRLDSRRAASVALMRAFYPHSRVLWRCFFISAIASQGLVAVLSPVRHNRTCLVSSRTFAGAMYAHVTRGQILSNRVGNAVQWFEDDPWKGRQPTDETVVVLNKTRSGFPHRIGS